MLSVYYAATYPITIGALVRVYLLQSIGTASRCVCSVCVCVCVRIPLWASLWTSMRHMHILPSRYFLYRHQDYMFPGIRMLFVYSDDDLVAVSSAHASLSLSLNASLSLSVRTAT